VSRLSEKLEVLRDEVLDTAGRGDETPPGSEIFDAVVRHVAAGEDDSELDMSLRDAIARRLAWGDREADILASSEEVCARLLRAGERALDERERLSLGEAVAEVGAVAARVVALAAIGRTGREKAALLREQRVERRLDEVHQRQQEEIQVLKAALRQAKRDAGLNRRRP
jgi:hypothetical protein